MLDEVSNLEQKIQDVSSKIDHYMDTVTETREILVANENLLLSYVRQQKNLQDFLIKTILAKHKENHSNN